MAKNYFCETYKGTGKFKIQKTSDYPFKINEVRILTKDGVIPVNEINVYKTALKIYVKNNDDNVNTKHKLRKKSNFINGYRYYPDINLCSNQTFVIRSKNRLKRPYHITISGYENISTDDVNANLQINGTNVSVNNPVNTSDVHFKP